MISPILLRARSFNGVHASLAFTLALAARSDSSAEGKDEVGDGGGDGDGDMTASATRAGPTGAAPRTPSIPRPALPAGSYTLEVSAIGTVGGEAFEVRNSFTVELTE